MLTCSICRHTDREAIDKSILSGEAERSIAKQFHVDDAAVHRHKINHLKAMIAANTEERIQSLEADLQRHRNRAEELYGTAQAILAAAVAAGDPRSAMMAVRTAVGVLAEARALAELQGAREATSSHSSQNIDAEVQELVTRRDFNTRCSVIDELYGRGLLPGVDLEALKLQIQPENA